jgi:hypothetical protein
LTFDFSASRERIGVTEIDIRSRALLENWRPRNGSVSEIELHTQDSADAATRRARVGDCIHVLVQRPTSCEPIVQYYRQDGILLTS